MAYDTKAAARHGGTAWLCGALLALVVPAACSEPAENLPPLAPGMEGGPPPRVVSGDAGAESGSPGAGGDAPGGPSTDGPIGATVVTVVIDSPTVAQIHPAKMRFVPRVSVIVEAPPGGRSDSVSGVKASVDREGFKGPSAMLAQTKIESTPESGRAVFKYDETPIDLSALPTQEYEIFVVANTVGGRMATASLKFVVDAGPVILITTPAEGKYYRASAQVDVSITDPMFAVAMDKVSMTLGQSPLAFNPGPGAHQFTSTIIFKDYEPALEGDQVLTVRAANSNGTEAVVIRRFIADDKGPAITGTVPKTGELVGRVITVSADVDDPAGVLDSSVTAVIGHGDKTFEVKLQKGKADQYSALFDTTKLPNGAIFPSVSFRASDVLGNESAVGYLVALDNTPPVIDLDPPPIRMWKEENKVFRCSWAFDPLGDDAVSDLSLAAQLFEIRARIEDRGNTPTGVADFIPIATVDPLRAQVFILDDTSQPLVVDTSQPPDGVCDALNPLLTPTTTPMSSKDALLLNLVSIAPGGTADYTPDPSLAVPWCMPGTANESPKPKCDTTNLTLTIRYSLGNQPAIWTLPPVVGNEVQCVGQQFDSLANHVKNGWICVAVAAADKLGNFQVSRPIRVCVNNDGMGNNCSGEPPPDCTGTVTSMGTPPVVDASKPCGPWRSFPAGEIREQ